MARCITNMGYDVRECNGKLDVFDPKDNSYICEILGKTLKDFTVNGEVDKEEVDIAIFDELFNFGS